MTPSERGLELIEQGHSVSEAADKLVNEYQQYKEESKKRE